MNSCPHNLLKKRSPNSQPTAHSKIPKKLANALHKLKKYFPYKKVYKPEKSFKENISNFNTKTKNFFYLEREKFPLKNELKYLLSSSNTDTHKIWKNSQICLYKKKYFLEIFLPDMLAENPFFVIKVWNRSTRKLLLNYEDCEGYLEGTSNYGLAMEHLTAVPLETEVEEYLEYNNDLECTSDDVYDKLHLEFFFIPQKIIIKEKQNWEFEVLIKGTVFSEHKIYRTIKNTENEFKFFYSGRIDFRCLYYTKHSS